MAFWQDWWTDRVRAGGKIDPLTDTTKGDWLQDTLGSMLGGVNPNEIHRTTDTATENLSAHRLLKGSGLSYEDAGIDPSNTALTEAAVGNALSNYRTTKKEKDRQTNRKDTIELTELGQKPMLETIREQARATNAKTGELSRQFDETQKTNRADSIAARADKADDRIAQLEMLEMQLAHEDRRTQEGWDRQDAKDQKEFLLLLSKSLGDLTTLFG